MIKIDELKIVNAQEHDLENMCSLWNEVYSKIYFYKPFTYEDYKQKLLSNPDFSFDSTFVIYHHRKLIAFAIGIIRQKHLDNENIPGYVNAIIVKEEYRNQGIGTKLLTTLENYFKAQGRKYSQASFFLPSCYSWYIPNTDNHDHPCAPGIRVNSPEYFFLINRRYEALVYEDAFHLPLSEYEILPSIKKIMDKNARDEITIELYDPEKHYGIDEFCEQLKIPDFEYVIKENLALENPYPFLVVSDKGRVVGWTGAMWNEESGRGHFDGIAILEEVRGRGLGKALFSYLAYYNKLGGAKFMTFYTGQKNHARYIYMGAGFKIVQTFAHMKKELK